jgi:DNA-binding NarL/FixJ family response regulator
MPTEAKFRILLLDDQPHVRTALRFLLELQQDLTLAGEARSATDLLTKVKATSPDCVLLDWESSGPGVAELIKAIQALDCHPNVIILSSRVEAEQEALAAGANAFVSKGHPPDRLLSAFRWLARRSKSEVLEQDVDAHADSNAQLERDMTNARFAQV